MLHLISETNAHLYHDAIDRLHRARKRVFIDELGWKLDHRDGMEFDEYDDERARNIVGFSLNGDVVMGLRFRPADDRSMLVDHFSQVLPSGTRPIDDGRTWELSRGFCIERGVRRHNLRRKAACMIAPLEIAYQAGIDRCVGFTDVRMLSFCYGVGWKMTILGEAMHYGEGDAVAYEVEVSGSALADMRQMWGLPEPACVEIQELQSDESSVLEAAERLALQNPGLQRIAAQPDVEIAKAAYQVGTSPDKYYAPFQNSG